MAGALQDAIARLEASRGRLRVQMIPPVDEGLAPGESRDVWPRRMRALWRRWRRSLKHWPLLGWIDEAVTDAWRVHPWRPTVELLGSELQGQSLALVRRHPIASVLAAAALGAAVVATRPWRWPLVAEQLRPLPRRTSRWLLRQLGRAPWQAALLAMLAAARQPDAAPPVTEPEPEREPTPATPAAEPG